MKNLSILLSVLLVLSLFAACGGNQEAPAKAPAAETPATEAPIVEIPATVAVETAPPETEPQAAYEIISKNANTWINSIGTPWVQTIIEVENTGSTNLFLQSCSYDLEDSSGSLIASHNYVSGYPQILAPGEKGVIYNETTLDAPVEGEITVLAHEDIDPATVELIRLPVSDVTLSAGKYMGLNMKGRVENTTAEEISAIYISAILYDADGKCIGQIFTIAQDVKAGDKVGFDQDAYSMPDSITVDTVASYEVFAYPRQMQF